MRTHNQYTQPAPTAKTYTMHPAKMDYILTTNTPSQAPPPPPLPPTLSLQCLLSHHLYLPLWFPQEQLAGQHPQAIKYKPSHHPQLTPSHRQHPTSTVMLPMIAHRCPSSVSCRSTPTSNTVKTQPSPSKDTQSSPTSYLDSHVAHDGVLVSL